MSCKHSNFWIGIGVGSVLGALAYRLSRTERVKKLERDIYDAIYRIGKDAELTLVDAENTALKMGVKAVEAGARAADRVAEKADKMAEEANKVAAKAKEKWDR